jgi:hypothetical protein
MRPHGRGRRAAAGLVGLGEIRPRPRRQDAGTTIGETGNLDNYASGSEGLEALACRHERQAPGRAGEECPAVPTGLSTAIRARGGRSWVAGDVMVKQQSGAYRDL